MYSNQQGVKGAFFSDTTTLCGNAFLCRYLSNGINPVLVSTPRILWLHYMQQRVRLVCLRCTVMCNVTAATANRTSASHVTTCWVDTLLYLALHCLILSTCGVIMSLCFVMIFSGAPSRLSRWRAHFHPTVASFSFDIIICSQGDFYGNIYNFTIFTVLLFSIFKFRVNYNVMK